MTPRGFLKGYRLPKLWAGNYAAFEASTFRQRFSNCTQNVIFVPGSKHGITQSLWFVPCLN